MSDAKTILASLYQCCAPLTPAHKTGNCTQIVSLFNLC